MPDEEEQPTPQPVEDPLEALNEAGQTHYNNYMDTADQAEHRGNPQGAEYFQDLATRTADTMTNAGLPHPNLKRNTRSES